MSKIMILSHKNKILGSNNKNKHIFLKKYFYLSMQVFHMLKILTKFSLLLKLIKSIIASNIPN